MSANSSQVGAEGARAGKLQVAFLVADCAVLIVTLVLGSAANAFVVHAVRRHRSLRTAANALLVNLALVDLLRCGADCPLLLLIVLRARGRADLGLAPCVAQLACFSLNCGAQLLTVAGISVERHRAVTQPLGGGGSRWRRVAAWIPFTWAAPALAAALCARFARDSPVYARCRGAHGSELRAHGSFGRYVLLPGWFACLAVIGACYAHIFVVVRAHGRKVFDRGVAPPSMRNNVDRNPAVPPVAETVSPGDPGEQKPPGTREGSDDQAPQTSPKAVNAPDLIDVKGKDEPAVERMDGEGDDASPANEHQEVHGDAPPDVHADPPPDVHADPPPDVHGDANQNAPQKAHEMSPQSAPQAEEMIGAVCMMPSLANRERINKKKESKLAKRSGYIIFTFLIFWLPLIGTIVLNVFLDRKAVPSEDFVQLELEVLAVCIACMTSLTNPIIYAAVNPQFRNEFYYLRKYCKALCAKT